MVDTSGAENPQDYGLSDEQAQDIAVRYRLGPSQFRQQSEQLQRRILSRIRFGDLPQQRAEFVARFHRGDNNEIAPDGYTRAANRLHQLRTATPTSALRGRVARMSAGPLPPATPPMVLEPTAGLAPNNTGWTSLGPGNIGGRIRSILINPTNAQNIYIGSVGGGVWITTDGGQNWQPADDLMANLAVCSMASVPNSPTTIYAGTGEGYYNGDAIQGNGIFKTTDGWVWQQLASTKATAGNTDFLWVNGIAVNNDGTVILAGTRNGIFRSTDGGATWSNRKSAEVGNILFNPTDNTKCIAAMLRGGGICYSTDGGSTWTQSTYSTGGPTIGRIQVCYAAKDPSIVYASVQTDQGGVPGSQIWQSTNGGQSFTKKNNATNYLGTQGWYDNIIWAGDPTNSNFVIVGGVDLYKSTDGGDTISQISLWYKAPDSAHADHHVIRSDPGYNGTSNQTVYFGNDGGLYKTTDVTTVGTNADHTNGWISLNSRLPITQFFSLSGKFTTSGGATTISSIVGGAQDNGTMRYTPAKGANAWNTWFGGDGGYVASDATSATNYYGEYVYLQICRSTDTGVSADYICGTYWNGSAWAWKPAPYSIPDAQNNTAQFIAPFALTPTNANCLLGGGQSLWRTNNPLAPNTSTTGPGWTSIKPPVPGATVSAIAIAPDRGDRVLVGYSNGQIYRSQNATNPTPTWDRADSGIGATRMCTSLAIDKNDDARFYATFGGFQSNNIWTSADAGNTWSNLGASLPPAPIYCVTIHPQNSQWLYLGTETGIFASEDGGRNWTPNNQGPTNCRIYQLAWMGNTLCCASHGRGIFAIDLTIEHQADLIVTGDMGGNLVSSNAQTGAKASSYAMTSGQITAQPLVDGVSVYCGYEQPFKAAKFADAHNLAAGPAWQTTLGGAVNATPSLVKAIYPGDPDVLYTIAADGKLYALNASTGVQLWFLQVVPSGQVGTGVNAYSNQAMNQWIYIATDKGLYAVNTVTRTVGWSAPYVCKAPPLLASNTVFAPTQSGKIYSVQARTGTENWNYDTGNVVGSTPVWVLGSVIAGNQGGRLVGLDYNTGALQFSQTFAGEQIDAIAADGNEIYFAGNAVNGHLYAYQVNISATPRSISQTWAVSLSLGAARPPQIVGTSLYLTTTNGKLQAFSTTNGASLWQQTLPRVALAAPSLVYA
ncbi:MAG: PQQ-binding-like beta-propeller repeat protein [Reyranella sp.]|nr:PQQ-binding-like beta-propeller repeat protein [Reyranella sp.]MBL6650059.1 PQQ-binding-like beta-propeller repeat protein [Reyranella sp.]